MVRNRKYFPALAQRTFRDIIGRGLLGDIEMKIFIAFRDEASGVNSWMYVTVIVMS
jgi:hypothetical protein